MAAFGPSRSIATPAERALHELFTRRIAPDVVDEVHRAVAASGAARFSVRHDDHFHDYLLLYSHDPRLLVFAEVGADGPREVRAWSVADASPHPRAPIRPTRCVTCTFGEGFCRVCGRCRDGCDYGEPLGDYCGRCGHPRE